MRRALALATLAALALACWFGQASAIEPKSDAIERILPGQPVRILYGGETVQGAFVMNSADSLILRSRTERRGLATSGVQGVRVRRTSRGAGLVIGLLVTTVGIVNVRSGDVEPLGVAVGGVLGGFLGSVVGAAIHRYPQVYPDPKTSEPLAWGPSAERTASVSLRAGYVTHSEGAPEHANQGFAGSVSVLARNDHTFAIGGEIGFYNIPEEDVVIDGTRFDGGRTTSITFETRWRPTHGHIRPTLHAGLGPYFDYVKIEYTNPGFATYVNSEVDWNFGGHFGPGIQVGSKDWSMAVEGRWHIVDGSRGDLANLFTITAGVTWH